MDSATPSSTRPAIWYLYRITLVSAVGGFLLGYDLSLISGAILFLKAEWHLSPFWVGALTGSAILGCPLGSMASIWLADLLGRNKALVLSALLFCISAIGSALAGNKMEFSAWRLVGGAGVGLASTISPMYIAEISPASIRGRLVTINQLAIVIGLSLSIYATYLLSFGGHWRWMFATMSVPAACLLAGLFFVPQSPRWLCLRGRDEAALRVLVSISGPEQAAREFAEIRAELGEETGGFRELLRPGLRKALWIVVALAVFSQINGVNMILLYAPTLFMEAGASAAPDALINSVYLTVWIILCTVGAFWLTARFGRRPILICGPLGMAAGHVLMFLRFSCHWPAPVTLAGMFLASGSFTLTLAPLTWVILSEIFPNRVRGIAMSISTWAMFTASYVTTNLFPVVLDKFKAACGNPGGAFLIFAGVCVACSIFVARMLPETKDKTLEEIGRLWLRLDST